jgi:hypothetical protein
VFVFRQQQCAVAVTAQLLHVAAAMASPCYSDVACSQGTNQHKTSTLSDFAFLVLQQSNLEEEGRVGGGGIAADWTYKVTAARCTFAHNTAYASPKGRGGAVLSLLSGDVAVVNSSFTNNSALNEVRADTICSIMRVLWHVWLSLRVLVLQAVL